MTTSDRFDKYEAIVLGAEGDVDVTDPELLPPHCQRNPHFDHPLIVLDRVVTEDAVLWDAEMADLAPEYPHVNWEDLAMHLIFALDPDHPFTKEDNLAPVTDSEWKKVMSAVLKRHFNTTREIKAWVRERMHTCGLALLQKQAEQLAASRAMQAMDALCRTGTRVDSRVSAAWKNLQRARDQFERGHAEEEGS